MLSGPKEYSHTSRDSVEQIFLGPRELKSSCGSQSRRGCLTKSSVPFKPRVHVYSGPVVVTPVSSAKAALVLLCSSYNPAPAVAKRVPLAATHFARPAVALAMMCVSAT
jgi:hypothetical protein